MSEQSKRIHAVVHGRVQGVFFRETTCQQARRLGLSGWVRNLANGTVETEFQGDQKAVAQMLDWLAQGSTLSRVTRVESREKNPLGGESEFSIAW
ncbi:MAG: acylphosphatase [Proteobacteria bacterium]|nr:acylphosphatase [Pseudomonadota bacterium]MBU1057250.1 acylphosphatase [Pseudomonadota bacterium]